MTSNELVGVMFFVVLATMVGVAIGYRTGGSGESYGIRETLTAKSPCAVDGGFNSVDINGQTWVCLNGQWFRKPL